MTGVQTCALPICQPSVNRYLQRASACGLSWPLPEDCDDRRLSELLFPAAPEGGSPAGQKPPVDLAEVHRQLQSNKYVTLQLLWEEYHQSQPAGYHYSQFCELYRRWRQKLDVVLRQDYRSAHRPALRADPARQAAPGDGLSLLPRDHPLGRHVLADPHGGRG